MKFSCPIYLWLRVSWSYICAEGLRPSMDSLSDEHSGSARPEMVVSIPTAGDSTNALVTQSDNTGQINVRLHVVNERMREGSLAGMEASSRARAGKCDHLKLPPIDKKELQEAVVLARIFDSDGEACSTSVQHAAPEVDGVGFLSPGPWQDCLHAAVAYEYDHPDWSSMPEFKHQGPAGMVAELFASRADDAAGIAEECMRREKEEHMKRAPVPDASILLMLARENVLARR
mmetsp:Transcript_62326/g.115677  ORF Transcript_62326/g.115677 Transcript_62326/m.115677 type:complete len:231 (+) Transcript_62326:30-722(+)